MKLIFISNCITPIHECGQQIFNPNLNYFLSDTDTLFEMARPKKIQLCNLRCVSLTKLDNGAGGGHLLVPIFFWHSDLSNYMFQIGVDTSTIKVPNLYPLLISHRNIVTGLVEIWYLNPLKIYKGVPVLFRHSVYICFLCFKVM